MYSSRDETNFVRIFHASLLRRRNRPQRQAQERARTQRKRPMHLVLKAKGKIFYPHRQMVEEEIRGKGKHFGHTIYSVAVNHDSPAFYFSHLAARTLQRLHPGALWSARAALRQGCLEIDPVHSRNELGRRLRTRAQVPPGEPRRSRRPPPLHSEEELVHEEAELTPAITADFRSPLRR